MSEKTQDSTKKPIKLYSPVSFLSGLDEIKKDLILRSKTGDTTYGLEILDDGVQFIRPATVTLIMACPNVGKSLLAQNIACHIAKQGKKVLFCSCEMSTGLLMERQLKQLVGVSSKELKDAYISHPSSIDTIFNSIVDNEEYNFLKRISVLDIGGITINELLEVLEKTKDTFDYVVIDYIQRVKGNGDSEYEQLKDVSYKLQCYAMDSNKGVIECSQIPKTNESENRTNKGIDFTKLRAKGGGNPEEDAHVCIKMAEDIDEQGNRNVLINLSKNKYGDLKFITYRYKINKRLQFELLNKYV